ncbi:MAG: hypothetical protein NTX46_03065 [Chloroflexi bacterium]|nr:hypothetical protein [Chloroflexota bacterium]
MTDNEKQPPKEDQRVEKRATEEIKQSARYQAIKKADLTREEAIQKTSKAKEIKRTEKRATDDIEQSARYQAIRKADLVREQAIAEAQEAAKLRAKK